MGEPGNDCLMNRIIRLTASLLFLLTLSCVRAGVPPGSGGARRILTPAGFPADESYFPIAVWLQSPKNAERFSAAGINLYVGLWKGPTEEQLAELKKANMPVICSQNSVARAHLNDPLIAAWMHGDEPDNAQSLKNGKGYGPPILPEVIAKDFETLRKSDPTRPVLLNLGQGVAFDNYIGRGVRRNHMEDYPLYVKGCDIVSFDIYPVVHESPEVKGKLEFVPRGVERLVKWTEGKKPVWTCIECTDIDGVGRKASPAQVKAEVWMALIRGSRGLIYFVHQFKPDFKEAALLSDPAMLPAVTAINQQIKDLAPVLNSETLTDALTVETKGESARSPVSAILKSRDGAAYVFAANFQSEPATVVFTLKKGEAEGATVLGESRKITLADGRFTDHFEGYGVHLYQLK